MIDTLLTQILLSVLKSHFFCLMFLVVCFQNVCKFWPSEQQPQMNPVPYLTVTWKVEDKSIYWRTHTLHLAESNAPVSTALLTAVQHLTA